jgi:pyrroline-5-carboxylate reductase
MKITFIGLGNMATAMLGGLLESSIVSKEDITGTDISESARTNAEARFGIATTDDNAVAVAVADIVVLAIKPQVAAAALAQIKDTLPPRAIVLSIMAGKSTAWIGEQLTEPVKIVRAMPNTPALVRAGISGVCRNAEISDSEMELCLSILRSFGSAEEVPETLMDAVVGVSGSSPAYVFIFIEALTEAAVAAGMPYEQAKRFAAGSVLGSARLVLETAKEPSELTAMVCSPGGTTLEAVKVFEEKDFRNTIIEAATAAMEKSKKLSEDS